MSRKNSKKLWSRAYPQLNCCRNPTCQAAKKPHYALGYCYTCYIVQWWHKRKLQMGIDAYRRWEADRKWEWRRKRALPVTDEKPPEA